jgi:hypothetical protein
MIAKIATYVGIGAVVLNSIGMIACFVALFWKF